jgi:hypothetical protein
MCAWSELEIFIFHVLGVVAWRRIKLKISSTASALGFALNPPHNYSSLFSRVHQGRFSPLLSYKKFA